MYLSPSRSQNSDQVLARQVSFTRPQKFFNDFCVQMGDPKGSYKKVTQLLLTVTQTKATMLSVMRAKRGCLITFCIGKVLAICSTDQYIGRFYHGKILHDA